MVSLCFYAIAIVEIFEKFPIASIFTDSLNYLLYHWTNLVTSSLLFIILELANKLLSFLVAILDQESVQLLPYFSLILVYFGRPSFMDGLFDELFCGEGFDKVEGNLRVVHRI